MNYTLFEALNKIAVNRMLDIRSGKFQAGSLKYPLKYPLIPSSLCLWLPKPMQSDLRIKMAIKIQGWWRKVLAKKKSENNAPQKLCPLFHPSVPSWLQVFFWLAIPAPLRSENRIPTPATIKAWWSLVSQRIPSVNCRSSIWPAVSIIVAGGVIGTMYVYYRPTK